MARGPAVTIVTAGATGYFGLLTDLLVSPRRGLGDWIPPLSILDIGSTDARRDGLKREYGATVARMATARGYDAKNARSAAAVSAGHSSGT